MQRLRGPWVIVLSSVFFAAMAVLARRLSHQVPAAQLSWVRFAVGLVGLGLLFATSGQRPTFGRPWLLALRGLFGSVAVVLYFVAIQELGTGPATVLNYCSPLWAALFAAVFLGERPGAPAVLGLLLASAGAVLVSVATGQLSRPLVPGLGVLAGVASGLSGGAAITVVRALRRDTSAPTVFLAFCLVGLLLTSPVALPAWVPLEGTTLLLALAMGVLSLLGQLSFTYGMGYVTATAGSAITQLVPVLAWATAAATLGEPVEGLALLGAVLCGGGVLLGSLGRR